MVNQNVFGFLLEPLNQVKFNAFEDNLNALFLQNKKVKRQADGDQPGVFSFFFFFVRLLEDAVACFSSLFMTTMHFLTKLLRNFGIVNV